MALVNSVENKPDIIVIDGYIALGAAGRRGLGAHLYKALYFQVPIIGAAKNRFSDTPHDCEVFRGKSGKPLFVTSIGIDKNIAKDFIRNMHGSDRLPTLIKAVDRECRDAAR